ncbi:MAG: outer membrane protein assembly factor BamD [Casimicrobiaceae bacterium]
MWGIAALLAVSVAGCSWLPEVKDETADWSAEKLYREAHDNMVSGNYTRATKLFEILESRFPYGRLAQQAILESAYANYRNSEPAAAIAAADRFIRTYPNHPNVDYAYYVKGLVNFREDQGLLGYVYEADLSEREPKAMRESFDTFKDLVAKFPQSKYAADADTRMRYLTNSLALYEVKLGRYYFNRGAYVAAANRAQLAITNYPRTPATEDALDLLARSYDKLELPQLRDDAWRVLKSTFPNSRYFAEAPSRPWWKLW